VGGEYKMKRAIIIVKGEVQGVGYRGVVFNIARKFEYFEVRRGDMTEELGERLDLARYEMKKLHQAQKDTLGRQDQTLSELGAFRKESGEKKDQMLEKQEVMIEKQDKTTSIIKSGVEEMRDFRTETSDNFTTLREDYGRISENIEKLVQSIDRTSKNTERIMEEMKEERKESRMAMDKILNAILKLAERKSGVINKPKTFYGVPL